MDYQFPHERFEARLSGCCIERADSRDRNTGGASTGNASGGSHGERSGAADAGRAAAQQGNQQYAGYRGPIGTNNPNTSMQPGSYGLSATETKAYNDAQKDYNTGRNVFERVFDTISPFGFRNVRPQINQPSSYAAGTYHFGWSPGAAIGGVAGGLAMPGLGSMAGGYLGDQAQKAAGLHDIVIGGPGHGFSTSYPDGGPGYNSSTGYAGPGDHTNAPGPKGDQGGSLGLIPGPVSPVPTIMQPKPATPAAVTPPPIFTPKPLVQNQFTVGGGSPYGFSIFGRTA